MGLLERLGLALDARLYLSLEREARESQCGCEGVARRRSEEYKAHVIDGLAPRLGDAVSSLTPALADRLVIGRLEDKALYLLLLSLGGIVYWQTVQQNNDVEEIDTHLLTGDLPINAYLDKDFDAWLKRSSL